MEFGILRTIRFVVVVLLFFAVELFAEERTEHGFVTYLSGSTVYISIGRANGVVDSTVVTVVSGHDTIGFLQVTALSSKSSSCVVLEMNRSINIGDTVIARIPIVEAQPETHQVVVLTDHDTSSVPVTTGDSDKTLPEPDTKPWFEIGGRIGLQYIGVFQQTSEYSLQQPGLTVNLRGRTTDLPLSVELYGTVRSQARGSQNPISHQATVESRIYRLSLSYDDQTNIVSFGRFISEYASSVGFTDGIGYTRRMGSSVVGMSVGLVPPRLLDAPSSIQKKILVFAGYQPHDEWNNNIHAAYCRIFSGIGVEREIISAGWYAYMPDGISMYSMIDIDMRTPTNAGNPYSPYVSMFTGSLSMPVVDFLSAGINYDVGRPVYYTSDLLSIADTLLDRQSRTNISLFARVVPLRGISLSESFTPRSSVRGFGKEYSNVVNAVLSDVFSSGVLLMASATLNENPLTRSMGLGLSLRRNFLDIDLGLRYQNNRQTIIQNQTIQLGETFSMDCYTALSSSLTLLGSYESTTSFGTSYRVVFLELNWRF
jgi:hypothetical protein